MNKTLGLFNLRLKRKLGVIVVFCSFFVYSQNDQNNKLLDSIISLRVKSQNSDTSLNKRLSYAKIAVDLSAKIEVDTTILLSKRNLSLLYFETERFENYKKINEENLELSKKLSDTTAIAVANFNLGSYFKLNIQNDSAFYYYSRALELYTNLNAKEQQAYLLYQIADIQDTEKDYVGSEENAIKAVKLIRSLPVSEANLDNLWSLNNLLGNISYFLERYDEALEYNAKAIDIADKMQDGMYNKTISFNNQASVYRELLNFDKSLKLYEDLIALRNVYEDQDPTFYPLILNNLAYTKVLSGDKDYDKISSMFYKAYGISNRLGDDITKLAVTIDLSKYYRHLKVKDSTMKYAEKAYELAKKISSNEILLESMVLLSELKEDDRGKKYLREYISLSDSLLNAERNFRNKSARIKYETDQLEAENEQIAKDRLYLAILSIGLLLTAILIYIVISQRAKNKELKLMQVQQKANEDIYNLMLVQQDKVDEARAKEKTRVSKELHDGVLGRLFGTRLSLDSLNFVEGKDAITNRANYINELKIIEEDIRKISHELNTDFVSGSGFTDIVSELIENQTQAYGLTYDFDFTDDVSWDLISNKTKINIYRIIQESMQNIYKHANAKHIKISISLKKNVICLDIIDDGEGFDTSRNKKGIGLKNMTSRVEDIDGEINFTSESNKGTVVNVKIPYIKDSE